MNKKYQRDNLQIEHLQCRKKQKAIPNYRQVSEKIKFLQCTIFLKLFHGPVLKSPTEMNSFNKSQ